MHKIKIIEDKVFSLDGINPREFKAGEILEVNERELAELISTGIIEIVIDEIIDEVAEKPIVKKGKKS